MAPIAKENEVLTATTTETAVRPSAAASQPSEGASKPQPVALEVPVSVNGARTVDGSDKREPFSESTKTVLVFGNGAVIRLQSPVAPGQLLFLTNDKTKKEVVCQVVKSKNYRNVSGYVELEFTETVVGFWGMRFPGDRIGGQSPAAGTSNAPVAAKPISQPVAVTAPPKAAAPTQPKPDATTNFNALKALTSSPTSDLPRTPDVNVAPPVVKAQPPAASSEVKPAARDASTEALKQQAARLQEELASMLFAEKANASVPAATPALPAARKEVHENTAKVLEFVKPEPPRLVPPTAHETPQTAVFAPPKPAQPIANAPVKSLLDAEEVKIPSWLEPLARNAANASGAEEAASKEEWRHREEPVFESFIAPEPEASSAGNEAQTATLPLEVSLPEPELGAAEPSHGWNKGLLIGAIAAGLVLAAAGGAWFIRNQSGAAQASTAAPVTTAAVVQSPTQTAAPSASGTPTNASISSPVATTAGSSTAYPAPNSSNTGAKPGNASVSNAVVKTAQPAPVQTTPPVQVQPPAKKLALGEVRLAAPTMNRKGQAQSGNEAEPGISLGNSEPVPNEALGGLESRSKGPAAPMEPLAVGGDVRPAKLVSSVSPIYPSLAKSQHVAGDVKVDALIDPNGKVTTMKVVSGPTLLHQAAMDALRQWKYQPAMLDGKTVPMHLTVTLQFRLQ